MLLSGRIQCIWTTASPVECQMNMKTISIRWAISKVYMNEWKNKLMNKKWMNSKYIYNKWMNIQIKMICWTFVGQKISQLMNMVSYKVSLAITAISFFITLSFRTAIIFISLETIKHCEYLLWMWQKQNNNKLLILEKPKFWQADLSCKHSDYLKNNILIEWKLIHN